MSQNSVNLKDPVVSATPAEAKALPPGAGAVSPNSPVGSPTTSPAASPIRRKRLSFGGGNDGRGSPMFANLEALKGRRLSSGYEDMKPADGIIGAAWKRWVTAKPGPGVNIEK